MSIEEAVAAFNKKHKKEEVKGSSEPRRILNRAVPLLAGFPGDIETLLRMATDATGGIPSRSAGEFVPGTGTPVGTDSLLPSSQDTLSVAERLGLDVRPPESFLGKAGELASVGGGFGLARGGVRALSKKAAPGLLGKVADVAKPTIAEGLIGGGAGLAGQTGESFGVENPLSKLALEVVGGLGTAGGLAGLSRAGRGAQAVFAPLSQRGQLDTASDVFSSALESGGISRQEALRRLGENQPLPGTVPQQLDSSELNAILKAMQNAPENRLPGVAGDARRQTRAVEAQRSEAIESGAALDPQGTAALKAEAADTLESFRGRMKDQIDRRMQMAVDDITKEGSETGQEVLSATMSRHLDDELKVVSKQEDELWEAFRGQDGDLTIGGINAENTKNLVKRIRESEGELALPTETLSDDVVNTINKMHGGSTLSDLQKLRSGLLNMERKLRGGTSPDFDQARKVNLVSDEILSLMEEISGNTISKALKFSRAKSDTFSKGSVAKLLGRDKQGADRVNALSTLDDVMTNRQKQGQNIDELRAAVNVQGDSTIEEFMRSRFQETAIVNGEVDAGRARSFLEQNKRALDRFPFLRNELDDAVTSAEKNLEIAARRTRTVKSASDRSMASKILGADVDTVVASAKLKTANDYREFLRQARDNPQARQGAVRAIAHNIITKSMVDDGTGLMRINPKTLGKELTIFNQARKNPILKPDEMKFLNMVLKESQKAERLNKLTGNIGITLDAESPFLTFLLRVGGARIGSAVGGKAIGAGQIQAAGAGARLLERVANQFDQTKIANIIEEAMFDKELARTLLMRPTNRNEVVIVRKLRGFLLDTEDDLREE